MNARRAFDALESMNLLNWNAVRVGWDHEWVTKYDISRYATACLERDVDDSSLADIAELAFSATLDDRCFQESLRRLSLKHPSAIDEEIEKWRLARLLELNATPFSTDEKLQALEELRAEFDYPPDMTHCTRWGPSREAIIAGLASSEDLKVDPLLEMERVIAALKLHFGVK